MNYYKYSYKNSVVVISTLIILVLIIFIPIKIESYIDVFVILISCFIHELLHGIGFKIFGHAKSKNINYGISLEKGIMYATCKEEINKKGLLISMILPFLVLTIILGIIGILLNNHMLLVVALYNLFGSSLDICAFIDLLKLKNIKYKDLDDNFGFILIGNNLDNKKFICLKLIEKGKYNNKIKAKDYRKLVISKFSIILLSLFTIIFILRVIKW